MKIIAAFLLLLLTQCAQKETVAIRSSNLNQETGIALNETIQLTGSPEENSQLNSVRVTFAALNDSRCPLNAMCIRTGSAVTQFWLACGQEQSPPVQLVIGEALPTDIRLLRHRAADTAMVTVANTTYQVILKQVLPYPCTSCPDQPTPKAVIQIKSQ